MFQKVLSGILILVLVTFMVVNRQEVTLSFYPLPFEVTAPLFFVFAGGLILGVIIAWILHLVAAARRRLNESRKDTQVAASSSDDPDAALKDL